MAPFPELPRASARAASARAASARRGASLVLAAIVGAIAALLIAGWSDAPRDDSAEAGFARDMATHHAQAVETSLVIRDKSSDEELRTLAYDITVTQSTQRGVFMGWLQAWGLPQASAAPRMTWMPGHAPVERGANGSMPVMHGMASHDELQRLHVAQGIDAEILFLQLMIRHHEGGVLMARAVSALSGRADVVGMAKSIEDGQRAEIVQMTEMLSKRGAQPYASLLD
jgi:uncharacterized protein (DUF305 family)